jgi:hypothetical protein
MAETEAENETMSLTNIQWSHLGKGISSSSILRELKLIFRRRKNFGHTNDFKLEVDSVNLDGFVVNLFNSRIIGIQKLTL